jgi:hypothetical protein
VDEAPCRFLAIAVWRGHTLLGARPRGPIRASSRLGTRLDAYEFRAISDDGQPIEFGTRARIDTPTEVE